MHNYLGEIIFNSRKASGLTQDQYGKQYSVSGPAVFKFEKGYVKPSLELWLRMAAEAKLSERKAVLLWAKARLPLKYRDWIEMQGAANIEHAKSSKTKYKADYSKCRDRSEMIALGSDDASLPEGLLQLFTDNELWALYKPAGREINALRSMFSPLGQGNAQLYREALRLIRDFAKK